MPRLPFPRPVRITVSWIMFIPFLSYFASFEVSAKQALYHQRSSILYLAQSSPLDEFFDSGETRNSDLNSAILNSGWSGKEIRKSMLKLYKVDPIRLARFLYSSEGTALLKKNTKPYYPVNIFGDRVWMALRSAIILDSANGTISSRGILKRMETGSLNFDKCEQMNCNKIFSVFIFLPACLQAGQKDIPDRSNAFRKFC